MISNTLVYEPNIFPNFEDIESSIDYELPDKNTSIDFKKMQENIYNAFQYSPFDCCDKALEEERYKDHEIKCVSSVQNCTTEANIHMPKAKVMKVSDLSKDQNISNNKDLKFKSEHKEDADKYPNKEISHKEDQEFVKDFQSISDVRIQRDQIKTRDWLASKGGILAIYSDKLLQKMKQNNHLRPKRAEGVKLARWNREKDREVFAYLDKILGDRMDLQEFLFDTTTEIKDDYNQIIVCDFRLEILENVGREYDWQNTPYYLFKRLQKLAKNQNFSFRETKLLKKTIRDVRNIAEVDIKKISSLFPGKSDESIKNECTKILNNKH